MPKAVAKSAPAAPSAVLAAPPDPRRFVCVHGHFYQPPRENPWLETVEVQDSAAPYHDWNDRITAECYAPNGASRITDIENRIIRIVNNYARMSYNFGPTLLSWLADKAPRTYRMVLEADKYSAQRYSGHGSAMAQVYNHIIMPLASRRDALTQIRWGIADFEHRFGRRPEGMWLAETAVNREVLDLMAGEGIRFTVLAPIQCARVRRLAQPTAPSDSEAALELDSNPAAPNHANSNSNQSDWIGTPEATVDPTHPYLVRLDEGRSIAVFFYDGPGSRAIAFEGLLNSGEEFGRRLLSGFHPAGSDGSDPAQLSHVATDGESYGHHHKHGEMALSYAMHWLEDNGHARLTNYGEFLEKFPPLWEAEVAENTSWSCVHGVERWRSNCGCNGGRAGWNQEWRRPLRDALDYLRDATAPLAEKLAEGLLKDLWAARDAYIHVVLARESHGPANSPALDAFLAEHACRPLSAAERVHVLELLELERHTQLMYTSCGWFFDEISGIETVQIIAYAGRVLQLAGQLFCDPPGAPVRFGDAANELEARFLEILALATSNVPEMGDGAQIYQRYVTTMRIGLEQVGAHYAISSVFRPYPEDGDIFCFDVHRDTQEVFASGRGKVALGRARILSRITEETEEICYAVLHLGDQNLSAAVRRYTEADETAFLTFADDVRTAIRRANLPEVIRLIDRFFAPATAGAATTAGAAATAGTATSMGAPGIASDAWAATTPSHAQTAYSLTSLFADEQHAILRIILNHTMAEMENSLRTIYEDHASLLHYLTEAGIAAPPALALAASFALNASLRRALEAPVFEATVIQTLLDRADADHVELDIQLLSFTAGQRMKRALVRLEKTSLDSERWESERREFARTGHGPQEPGRFEGNRLDTPRLDAAVPQPAPATADPSPAASLHTAILIAETLAAMPFEVNLWQAQNIWNDLLRRSDSSRWSEDWKSGFKKLGLALNIDVDRLVVEEGVPTF